LPPRPSASSLFQRLGLGAILGFVVAGVLTGPYTPGPVPVHAVEELASIAELGVVLFIFTVGLEPTFRA
jgi:glutathione-regulated potassium-efflux system protein KefB